MKLFALHWFARMQAGEIEHTEYAAAYGAQLTDDAVQAMSHHLNEYGASPIRAEIICFAVTQAPSVKSGPPDGASDGLPNRPSVWRRP